MSLSCRRVSIVHWASCLTLPCDSSHFFKQHLSLFVIMHILGSIGDDLSFVPKWASESGARNQTPSRPTHPGRNILPLGGSPYSSPHWTFRNSPRCAMGSPREANRTQHDTLSNMLVRKRNMKDTYLIACWSYMVGLIKARKVWECCDGAAFKRLWARAADEHFNSTGNDTVEIHL